jgi:hypothetical protein
MDAITVYDRLRRIDRPPTHPQLQSAVVVGAALLIVAPFLIPIPDAENPLAAIGMALQTLAGVFGSARLWANGTADLIVNWVARQIGRPRRSIVGLLDGRPLSLFLATGCYVMASLLGSLLWNVAPDGVGGLIVAVPGLLALAATATALILSMFMFTAALLSPSTPLPDGAAVTGAYARLAASSWVWPSLGVMLLVGGLLQTLGS